MRVPQPRLGPRESVVSGHGAREGYAISESAPTQGCACSGHIQGTAEDADQTNLRDHQIEGSGRSKPREQGERLRPNPEPVSGKSSCLAGEELLNCYCVVK